MISKNLMFLRNAHHFTLEEVAEKIGVSRQAVAKWENGETVPDLMNSIALSKLYGVTIDDLVHHDQDQKGYAVPPIGKHIFGNVTVGERGQIVIPKKARDIFDFHPGESLIVIGDEEQGGIALVKSTVFMKMAEEILAMGGISNDSHQNDPSL